MEAIKILHLTLKKKWFDMELSGEKPEEYREIKLYWLKRLMIKGCYSKKFDIVRCVNGYGADKPSFDIEWKGLRIGTGREEWGAEPGKKYLIIKLGDIVEKRNC